MASTQNTQAGKDETARIAKAIEYTFENNNGNSFIPRRRKDDERQKHIFCAEWVAGFRNAAQFEIDQSHTPHFKLEYGAATVSEQHEEGLNRVHVWLKISPVNGGPPIYVDDAFANCDSGGTYDPNNLFVHPSPPIPRNYTKQEGAYDLFQETEWSPPDAYDSTGNSIQDPKYQQWIRQ